MYKVFGVKGACCKMCFSCGLDRKDECWLSFTPSQVSFEAPAQDNIFREDREFVSFRPPERTPFPRSRGPLPPSQKHVISRVMTPGN